jgi:hypothetical protein
MKDKLFIVLMAVLPFWQMDTARHFVYVLLALLEQIVGLQLEPLYRA